MHEKKRGDGEKNKILCRKKYLRKKRLHQGSNDVWENNSKEWNQTI